MSGITNGLEPRCFGILLVCALLVPPRKVSISLHEVTSADCQDGIKPVRTVPTCPSHKHSVSPAIIYLTAGCIGAFIVDPLNHYLGRRGEIFLTAAVLTATPIASGFARTWQELFAIRFVMGIGIGAKNATVPIFSAELAPARIRGALVMFWQLWVVAGRSISLSTQVNNWPAGIFLGFSANVIVKDTGDIAWRLQLGSAFIPAFFLMLGVWFTPESPRWLMKHGKYDKAFRSFLKLRAHPIISARDYYYSYVMYEEEKAIAVGSTYFSRMRDIFTVPRIRRANYGASTVMLAQQMCGINSEYGCNGWTDKQLFRFTHLPSSKMSGTLPLRLFTLRWDMEASRWSLPFLPFSW
jgi:MFS family permease